MYIENGKKNLNHSYCFCHCTDDYYKMEALTSCLNETSNTVIVRLALNHIITDYCNSEMLPFINVLLYIFNKAVKLIISM